jgi:prepilin-type N-terminal cleavage/methylation domain-containing protein
MNDEKKELQLEGFKVSRIWTAGREAFTLAELLVVITVMGILASLLLTGLSQARQRAGSAGCKNNLRQWSLALKMYTTDYDVYPPYSMTDSKPELLQSWHKRLEKYGGGSIGACPEYARHSGLIDDFYCGYGYNRSGISSVVRQAEWVLLSFARPRLTFSRISQAEAVQTNGLGSALWTAR